MMDLIADSRGGGEKISGCPRPYSIPCNLIFCFPDTLLYFTPLSLERNDQKDFNQKCR